MIPEKLRWCSGSVTIRSGSEGPAHDPYCYAETIVNRDGHEYKAHHGLVISVSIDGDAAQLPTATDAMIAFRNASGYTITQWQRFFSKYERNHWKLLTPQQREDALCMYEFDAMLLRYAQ